MDLVINCFTKNYFNFSGRARRQEYWLAVLVVMLINIVLTVIDGVVGLSLSIYSTEIGLLSTVFTALVFIPLLAVAVRRLHDRNMSGWWILLYFIPILGLVMIIFFFLKGTEGENRFGPDPLVGVQDNANDQFMQD